jgi:hypothetical protein
MSSPDIRAGISLLIAALSAKGTSTIQNIEQIDRGYERIDERLRAIGASIVRDKNKEFHKIVLVNKIQFECNHSRRFTKTIFCFSSSKKTKCRTKQRLKPFILVS